MCGIAGMVDFTGRAVDEALLLRMAGALHHRGPDDGGIARFPAAGEPRSGRAGAGLASRRLSIIDVQGGRQPITNEDRTVWAVLNGEIYNFQALRETLEARGHRFATRSDTEVIVHLYEERGDDFVASLDGMFALALWDERRQRLVLARDRFGKKPLVYADRAGRLTFASELQALLLDPAVSRDVDARALDYYLTYMAVPAPLTIYRAVKKLPPAHLLVSDARGTVVRRYWTLPYGPKLEVSEAEALERLRALLARAVRARLVSEVPLGAFLSGGVDSSAVVALMAAASDRPVKTFSIGFADARYNELPHARRVARAFGTDHHEFVVEPHALDVLPRLVRHFGEPFADSSALPSYYLSRLTREHVTVALNGDGGDEVFAGYGRHLASRLAEGWQRAPAGVRRLVEWTNRGLALEARDRRAWPSRVGRFVHAAGLSRDARYERWVGVLDEDAKAALLDPGARPRGGDGLIGTLFADARGLDAIDAALAVDTSFYLPTDLLVKMDITSMANSVEARSPLLDHHLVEFVARLPSRLKVRGWRSKYLLKRAVAGVVPRENLERAKRGFAVPIAGWFRGELRELLADYLLAPRIARLGFRPASIEALIRRHAAGDDLGHQLWVLLMLELWYREFVER